MATGVAHVRNDKVNGGGEWVLCISDHTSAQYLLPVLGILCRVLHTSVIRLHL